MSDLDISFDESQSGKEQSQKSDGPSWNPKEKEKTEPTGTKEQASQKEINESIQNTLKDIDDFEKIYGASTEAKKEFDKLRSNVREVGMHIRADTLADSMEDLSQSIFKKTFEIYRDDIQKNTDTIMKDIDGMEQSGHVTPEVQKQLEEIRKGVQNLGRDGIEDMRNAMDAHMDTTRDDTGEKDPLHEADKDVEKGYREMASDKQKAVKNISFHSMKTRAAGFTEKAVTNFANYSRETMLGSRTKDAELQLVQIKRLNAQIKQMRDKMDRAGESWSGFKTLMTGKGHKNKPPKLYAKIMKARIQKAETKMGKCAERLNFDRTAVKNLSAQIEKIVTVVKDFNTEHSMEQPSFLDQKIADAETRADRVNKMAEKGGKIMTDNLAKNNDVPVR